MDKDETIVTDISEEELEQKPVLSQREAMIQELVDINREASADQMQELEDQLVESDPQDEEEVILEPEPENEEPIVEDKFVTVKVNGRSYEVEAEKVEKAGGLEAYQRNAAASEKQREVAAREATVKKREEELVALEKKILNPDPVVNNGEFGKQFADQMFDNPEAVAETINTLESRTRKAEEVAAKALQKIERDEKEKQQTVVQYFHQNHKNIAVDQEFTTALNSRLGAVAAENPTYSQQQVIDAAAEQVYAKFNISNDRQEPVVEEVIVETPAPKRRKPTKAPSRATSQKVPEPEVKPKTTEEVIREIARSRKPGRRS